MILTIFFINKSLKHPGYILFSGPQRVNSSPDRINDNPLVHNREKLCLFIIYPRHLCTKYLIIILWFYILRYRFFELFLRPRIKKNITLVVRI